MEAVKSNVTNYFKEYGITITVLGLKEGISYENPAIQKAIDEKFASEQKLVIQQNENEANIAKAEAEAESILIAAEAQAKANKLLSESLTDKILSQMYYERWNGVLPYFYGAEDTLIEVPAE
jgi:regulator of protease activity HflC (stomatin/prohibitin superfamily)